MNTPIFSLNLVEKTVYGGWFFRGPVKMRAVWDKPLLISPMPTNMFTDLNNEQQGESLEC